MKIEEDDVFNGIKRKTPFSLNYEPILLPTAAAGENHRPSELVVKKSNTGSTSGLDTQSELEMKPDREIWETITTHKKTLQLPNEAEMIKAALRTHQHELERRHKLQLNKKSYYDATVTIRCNIGVALSIRDRLQQSPPQDQLFRSSCFGRWLDLRCKSRDPSLVHLLLQTQYVPNQEIDHLMFLVGGQQMRFGREEFCLITGLLFGPQQEIHKRVGSTFRDRVFLEVKGGSVKVKDLTFAFSPAEFNKLTDEDAVRLCLLILLYTGFLGREAKLCVDEQILLLVDDLDAWNNFPWGSYIWDVTFPQLRNTLGERQLIHLSRHHEQLPSYSLTGFIWAFKIWIYEVLPHTLLSGYCLFERGTIPRALGWKRNNTGVTWESILSFVTTSTQPGRAPLRRLVPTGDELATNWLTASLRFFEGGVEKIHPSVKRARVASPLRVTGASSPCRLTTTLLPHRSGPNPVLVSRDISHDRSIGASSAPQSCHEPPTSLLQDDIASTTIKSQFASSERQLHELHDLRDRVTILEDLRDRVTILEDLRDRVTVLQDRVDVLWRNKHPHDSEPQTLDLGDRVDHVSHIVEELMSTSRGVDEWGAPTLIDNVEVQNKDDRSDHLEVAKRTPVSTDSVAQKDSPTSSPDRVAGNKPSESQYGAATNALTVDATKHDSLTDEKMHKIVNELVNVGISETDVGKAAEVCYNDPVKVKVLFALPTHMRRFYVLGFLQN